MRGSIPNYRMLVAVILALCLPPRGQAQQHQVELLPNQVYTNKATQFQFPPKVAAFQRQAHVTEFDPGGRDIGVGYNHPAYPIAVTVFVYPIAQSPPNDTLQGHFETCKADVREKHPEAKLLEQGQVKVSPNGHNREGFHATFTFTETFVHPQQTSRSELYLFTHRGFFVLFRITYLTGHQATAEPALKEFIDRLPWPSGTDR